jgi:cell division protein ZapA (FtsZ GTPase activity inhibitor)
MSQDTQTITLLNKSFHIKHPQDDHASLEKAAVYLDSVLRTIHQTSNNVSTFENTLVTAALNLCDELLQLKTGELNSRESLDERLLLLCHHLEHAIEEVLAPTKIVEIF